jgi:hypothetical protein
MYILRLLLVALAAKLEPPAFIPKPIYDYSFIGFTYPLMNISLSAVFYP